MAKKSTKVVSINSTPEWDSTAAATWEADKKKSKFGGYKRCYESHPALELKLTQGMTRFVYGGSCGTPIHSDADIYVGLDYSFMQHEQRLPWKPGHAIHYKITDMSVPKKADEFIELIAWLAQEIIDGKKVHVGCIGGHGRTGIVLSALVAVLTNEEDPITYVRKNYCKKAVESTEQVEFLMKYFDCKEVEGAKVWKSKKKAGKTTKALKTTINPVFAKHCIFGDLDVTP